MPSWIGIITAVPPVTRFTVLPLVTGLAERRQSLRGAMIVTAFATALGFAVIGTQHLPLLVFLAYRRHRLRVDADGAADGRLCACAAWRATASITGRCGCGARRPSSPARWPAGCWSMSSRPGT